MGLGDSTIFRIPTSLDLQSGFSRVTIRKLFRARSRVDVRRALGFYRDLLGFKLVDEFRHEGIPVYARLRAPGGDGTIALHLAGPGTPLASDGVRLYFEIREVDDFCRKLQAKGFYITQMPRMMPWGWRHAYLNDPDGHEISIYWAGENRMKKTVMRAAKEVAQAPSAKGR